jgi:hypothetical protein
VSGEPNFSAPHAVASAAAWKCAPRDAHIGWDKQTREAWFHLVIDNARFLILLNVRVANLASTILA